LFKKIAVLTVFMFVLVGCTPEQYVAFVWPNIAEKAETVETTVEDLTPDHKWEQAVKYSQWNEMIHERQLHPFLTCTRYWESDRGPWPHVNGYNAVNPTGTYRGAYQFHRRTWDDTAVRFANRPDLVGIDPASAHWWDQDEMALALYNAVGAGPWLGRCAGR
jgi:hypothetical protein